MSARTKLNAIYVVGMVMIAAILGALTSSWIVFLAALALLLACSLHAGSIRPRRGR